MNASHALRLAHRLARALGAAAVLGALAAPSAAAQTPAPTPARPGFWMDAGVGYGRLRLTCATCTSIVAVTGPAYTISVGGAPSQNVVLGVEGEWYSSGGSALRQQVQTVVAMVQWYPWPRAGFFVRGGVGIVRGNVALTADTTGAHSTKGTGVALTLNVGYDLRFTRHFAVALQAATNVAALGDLAVGGAVANDVIAYVSRIGVALVWR
jgi:Outer membrane protein beta-barrel domain